MLKQILAARNSVGLGLVLWLAPLLLRAEIAAAGASFPAPLIEAWAEQFPGSAKLRLAYQSMGSGEGIRRVTERDVDFAVTEVPLTPAELRQDDLLQYPLVVGAIVPVVNLPGIKPDQFKMTGPLLADIFLGRVTRWDDKAILALNPSLALPALPIVVVHRSDGSGSSFVFTHYLSKVSNEWRERLGIGSRLHWPVGVGQAGNEGIATKVQEVPGAIGYVQLGYALKYQLSTLQLRNHAGNFVSVSDASVRSALSSANWSRPGFYETLTDRDGEQSWPIVGVSFVLLHKQQNDRDKGALILNFQDWCYRQGAALAQSMHYVGVEDPALIAHIEENWASISDPEAKPVWQRK